MLYILRGVFVVITGIIGWYMGLLFSVPGEHMGGYLGLGIGLLFSILFVVGEVIFTRRYFGTLSLIMFGLIFGFIISYLFTQTLFLLPWMQRLAKDITELKEWFSFGITFVLSFISIIAIIRSKDDFKFVIPFIELSKEGKETKPFIVDTSVIIDGRIAEIGETKIIQAPLIVPHFVLMELQRLADSADRSKRTRGRHGLDILNKIKSTKNLDIRITEVDLPNIQGTDNKLIELSKHLNGRLMTTDFNLNKVAQLQGIEVININDLANSLRQVVLPGEMIEIKIIRAGEEHHQGIGYLDDGTMIVVEGASNRIGQRINLTVTSVIQTSAGRMIFGAVGAVGAGGRQG